MSQWVKPNTHELEFRTLTGSMMACLESQHTGGKDKRFLKQTG